MRIIIISSTLIILGISACTKYPEGPAFSLRTKTNRVAGVWHIHKYEIDGVDSLQHMGFETHEYVFGSSSCDRTFYGRNCTNCAGPGSEWSFSTIDKKLLINLLYIPATSPFSYSVNSTAGITYDSWEIMRLKNKEMILESYSDVSNSTIRITLVKENNKRPCE